jgi:hypothetical protein
MRVNINTSPIFEHTVHHHEGPGLFNLKKTYFMHKESFLSKSYYYMNWLQMTCILPKTLFFYRNVVSV